MKFKTKSQRKKVYGAILKDPDLRNRGICTSISELCTVKTDDGWRIIKDQFPEFDRHFNPFDKSNWFGEALLFKLLHYADKDKWRIKVLKSCIKMCETRTETKS
jgi:hypothetical protein